MTPKINYEKELNKNQLEAVMNLKGPLLVIAGAGSGKTRTLIYRVAYMIEQGIIPSKILLLTFTRKAASNMMYRAKRLLDNRAMNINGGTFHSLANMILRQYCDRIGYNSKYTILDQGDAEEIINLFRSKMRKEVKSFPKKTTIHDIIGKHINTNKTIQEILINFYPELLEFESEIQDIESNYKVYKKENNVMDYDDLLVNFKNLLKHDAEVRDILSSKYEYIMIDEYQDTNRIQAEISYYLASGHSNIMIVGDDSQSIYSFRGATFKNIFNFPEIFKNTKIIKLEQNYRSIQPILNFTNAVIENAAEKYTKKLFSDIKGEAKPLIVKSFSIEEEASFICDKIIDLSEKDLPLNEIAVLFRASWHSNFLELELNKRNIAYQKFGGIRFTDASHIKDILCFLRISLNPLDNIAWLRILLLFENIGVKTAEKIIETINLSKCDITALKDKKFQDKKFGKKLIELSDAIPKVRTNLNKPAISVKKAISFLKPELEEKYEDFFKRENDIEFLETIASKYNTMEDFLASLTIETPEISQSQENANNEEKLTLSTIHSAKGLEWNTVFVINLVDGRFPSQKSINSTEESEEERRLFYVACTRAKKRLFLLTNKSNLQHTYIGTYNSNYMNFSPSLFLREIKNLSQLAITEEVEMEGNASTINISKDYYSSNILKRINDYFD